MSFTLVFREITTITEDQLENLEKMPCMDILNQSDEFFCITYAEAMQYKKEYKNILQYCKKLTSSDGVGIYVAKSRFYCFESESTIYDYLHQFSKELHDVYVDITDKYRDIIRLTSDKRVSKRMNELQIPSIEQGSRLFYMANWRTYAQRGTISSCANSTIGDR